MIHIGEISFCDKIAYNIKNDDIKKDILMKIENKYNLKIIAKHFDKFENTHINNINNNPYAICLRTNGNPYFLYLTKINFVNYSILIDKKIQHGYFYPRMIITNYHFSDYLYNDTIIDGEMIKNNDNIWVFIVNDLIVYNEQYLHNVNIIKRLDIFYNVLKNDFDVDIIDINKFQIKRLFKYHELKYINDEYIPTLNYTVRGIYFKPMYMKYKDILLNFNDLLIKNVKKENFKNNKQFLLFNNDENKENDEIKEAEDIIIINKLDSICEFTYGNTSDDFKTFKVKKTNTPDIYDLMDNNNNIIGNACVPTMQISKYMRNLFINKNVVDTIEMKFKYSTIFNNWIPELK